MMFFFVTDYDRIIKNIERGEARISRKDEIMKAIGKKLDRYKNPWLELKIQYGQNKGKLYNEECDRFMVSKNKTLETNKQTNEQKQIAMLVINLNKFLTFTDLHGSQTWVWKLGRIEGCI